LWGDGSGYAQHRSADYAAWIVEEVPEAAAEVDSRCRTRRDSSAGCRWVVTAPAARLAESEALHGHQRAQQHHACGADAGFVEESLAKFDLTDSNPLSVIECAKLNTAPAASALRLRQDDALIEHNRTLHRELEEAGIPHVYEEFSGGHTWDYWHEHLADTLRFFKACLAC
jgi:putative tributyrin esterase